MKRFTYSLSMTGFDSVTGTVTATDRKDASRQAIAIFAARNDIAIADETFSMLLRFYSPVIKPAK